MCQLELGPAMGGTRSWARRIYFERGKAFLSAVTGVVAAAMAGGEPNTSALAAEHCVAADEPGLSVTWQAGRLSVYARECPLHRVLEEIGAASGAEIVLYGDLDAGVNGCFEASAAGDLLRRLAPKAATVIVQEGAAPGARLVKLIVYNPSDKGRARPSAHDTNAGAGLASEAVEERIRAVHALARSDTAGAAARLKTVLKGDRDATVRAQAARALASAGDARDADALLDALDDPDETVRIQAARAMGRVGGQQATQTLGDVLLHEDDSRVRTTAAWSLARIGGSAAKRALRRAQDASDPDVRRVARQALGRWEAAVEADKAGRQ